MKWEVTTRVVIEADDEADACWQVQRYLQAAGWDTYLIDSAAGEEDEEESE